MKNVIILVVNFFRSEDCKDKYAQALVETKSATSIISLYTDLDDENNSDIDSLVEKSNNNLY